MTVLKLSHILPDSVKIESDAHCAVMSASIERPCLPFPDKSFAQVIAIDALEHVMDEEAWLHEIARVMQPGASLQLQVPYAGLTSWWESLNIYRYLVDVFGRGREPVETEHTGWHRQYGVRDLSNMLNEAGFSLNSLERHSVGLAEAPSLVRLLVGDFVLGDPETGAKVHDRRVRLDQLDRRVNAGPLSRRLLIAATRNS